MATAGTDLLWKILGLGFFVYLIWIFLASGVVTSISFNLNNVPWYAWAIILLVVFIFFFRKKK